MITENNKILIELQRVLSYKFVFFLPFDILHIENVRGVLNFMGIKLTQEFVDEYVDSLLIFDFDLEIHHLDTDPSLIGDNGEKAFLLQENCNKLADLKDTLGKTSFRNLFNKYTEQIVALNYACDMLVEFYYKYFPDEKDITYIFRQQKLALLIHLKDIEKTFIKKGKSINSDTILQDLQKSFLTLPPVREKVESDEVSEDLLDERQNDHCQDMVFNNVMDEQEDKPQENHTENLTTYSVTENDDSNNSAVDSKKYLRNFIIQGDAIKIEQILVSRFKDRSPSTIKYLIESLEELNYIILIHGDLKKFVEAINNSFGNSKKLNYQSVTSPKVNRASNKSYKKIKMEFIKIIGH